MDGQYPPSTSSIGTFYPAGYPPMMPPEMAQSRPHSMQSMSMDDSLISSYPDPENPSRTMQASSSTQAQPQPRPPRRRREPPGADHVKHKRTRSGCFTCRQRRVKCDEARPVCDRCRKGNRDCTYPGNAPTAASSSSSKKGKGRASPSGSSPPGSDPDAEEREPLSAIPDDDDNDVDDDIDDDDNDADSSSAMSAGRKPSSASAVAFDDIASPLTDRSSTSRRGSLRPQASRTASRQSIHPALTQTTSWSALPTDVKFYLKFHRENLTYHHYAFRYDGNDFLHTTLVRTAINDQSAALLYAIVAFAAYHHSLTRDDDKIFPTLSYYNQSIVHLQQALMNRRHTVATLLTTLQLAAIEEYLGDWVNLLGHQRAAHQLLVSLFTPQTIMQDETSRKIMNWYIRFDLFAGMLSGDAPSLNRDWYLASAAYYQQQARENPSDLGAQFEEQTATSQLLAADVALLFAAKTKDAISDEQFTADVTTLAGRFAAFGHRIENAFTDPACFAQSFPGAPPLSADDIVDFREPNFFYSGAFSTMNFVLMAFWAIDLMFKYKLAVIQQQPPPPELTVIALKKCKMFEAIQYCDDGPAGGLLACQSSLTLAALFLPQDAKHTTWCRRKFVLIEQSGYILPKTFRARVSAQWGIDVSHWWLPNDEGYPTIVRAIRDFIEYRAASPPDSWQTGVKNMSGIFHSMRLGGGGGGGDQSSPEEFKSSYTDSEMIPSP